MFNKNAVVSNGDGFPEVYSTDIRMGNNNYDMLNPYKWAFWELDPSYLQTYLQTAFINKLFMKLIKNDNGEVIAFKNILVYKDQLTGIDLKRVERYFNMFEIFMVKDGDEYETFFTLDGKVFKVRK